MGLTLETQSISEKPSSSSITLWIDGIRAWVAQKELKSEVSLWAIAFVVLTAAYTAQFQWVREEGVFRSISTSLINVVPIVLIGVSVRLFVRRYLIKRPVLEQIGLHFLLAIAFAHLWYLLILVFAGFRSDWLTSGINLSPFFQAASQWQLLQGIVVYSAMQGLIYGRWLQEQLRVTRQELNDALLRLPGTEAPTQANAVFVKSNGEFQRIDLEDLIHLEADGDQVRLHARLGSFPSNRSLSSFAMQLEDSGFIRIHRSHLVRANDVLSAEPTGDGRLSVHLSNGTSLVASRTGTRAFKEYAKP